MSSNLYAVSAQESAQYQQKFTELVGNTQELLTGEKARTFFLTSGLSTDLLWKIWNLVDQEKRGKISYQQFQVAMTVIKSVRKGNPLPSFIPQEVLTGFSQPAPSYPSLQPQNIPIPPTQPTNPVYNRTPSPDLPAIDPNTKRKYIQQFNTLDVSRTGFVTGVQVKATMSKSFLPHLTLGKIWTLADCDNDGRLSSHEFVLAMHLIELAKLDMVLPDKLPHHLLPYSTAPSVRKTPSPPQGQLPSLSNTFPTRPLSPLLPTQVPLPTTISSSLPANTMSPSDGGFQLDLSLFKQADPQPHQQQQQQQVSKTWGDFELGIFTDDSVEMRKDRKMSLEDSKRENFLRGQQFLQRRTSEQFQQEDRRASELLHKKKSEEKLRIDRERVEHERRRTNSIKEIKLDKERELVQLRRQQLEQERTRLNEEVDSLKSRVSSLQAEEEHLDMRKVDLESRLWHQDQFITSLKREVQTDEPPQTEDKDAIQAQVKTQTNRLASLVSRKELLKRHLKSRENTQSDHLKEHASLSEQVGQLKASLNRLREEKSSLEAREPILSDKLSSLRKEVASTSQQARNAKQRTYELECKVRTKRGGIELQSAGRMRSGAMIDSTSPIPVQKPVATQNVKFDPFEASLRSINAANANRGSNIPDLVNVFTSIQPQPLAREDKVIKVAAKPKETQPKSKIESLYETAGSFLIEPSLPISNQKQEPKEQLEDQGLIYQTSYNPLPDETTTSTQQENPDCIKHDTYVDSNTLMEFYASIKQKQEENIKPPSLNANNDQVSSSVQDNIHYQVSPKKSDPTTKPRRPPYPTKSSKEPVPSSVRQRLSALYDFESQEDGVLSFKKGDMFSWRPEFDGPSDGWMGAEINGKTGIVPESYMQKMQSRAAPPIPVPYSDLNKKSASIETPTTQPSQPSQPVEELYAQPQKYLTKSQLENESGDLNVDPYQVEARVAYKGRIAEQISFEKGAVITVTKEKAQSKWLYGSSGSNSGWFPKFSVVAIHKSAGIPAKPQPKAVSTLAVGGNSNVFDDSFEKTCDVSNQSKPVLDISSALNQVLGVEEKSEQKKKEITSLPKSQVGTEEGEMYLALFDFNGTQEGDLVFKKNDNILISKKYDDWLYGEYDGKSGYLPANYVAKISRPRASTDESPIYDNIEIPTAPKRIVSTPAANTPPSPTSDHVGVTKRRSLHDIRTQLEQINTVYTASVQEPKPSVVASVQEPKPSVVAPIISKSQPTHPFPQAAPRAQPAIKPNSTSLSVDASQEEQSIAPFTTTASMRFKQRGGDFSFQAGDKIYITKSRANGKWYYGQVESSGNSGWFPCSFVPTKLPESTNNSSNEQVESTSPEIGSYYIALYDYHQAYSEDLSFKKGDEIKLVNLDGEWATGEFNGKRGYFPFKYVRKSLSNTDKGSGPKYTALFSYTAQNDDEISFSKGDVITSISKSTEYWWSGELNGKVGLFPANNVQEVREAFVQKDAKSLEKEMDFVITEIISSELAYLTDLNLVDELIFQPIEKNRLLTQAQLKQIMVNWRELVAVSKRMVEGMETNPQDPKKSFITMANLFHAQMTSLQRFVTWCSNQSNAINLMLKKLEGDASIRELQDIWSQDPRTTYLPISSFMLKPMQRVTKYQLFMKRLLELCPSGDASLRAKVEASLSQMENICQEANEGVRQQENKTKVQWVFDHLEYTDNEVICKNIICGQVEEGRQLLYTGKLVKTNSNKELVGFLFTDLLLLTRPSKNLFQRHISTSDLFEDEECKLINYRCPYKFKNIVSIKQCVGDECCFLLEVFDSLENQIRSLQLRAEGINICKNWIKLLEEGMNRCHEDKLFEVSSDVGGGLAEALRSEYVRSSTTGDVDLM